MYELFYKKGFLADVEVLDKRVAAKLRKSLILLEKSPFHPSLGTKFLKGPLAGFYSFRVGGDHRCIFIIREKVIELIRIKPRGQIYR